MNRYYENEGMLQACHHYIQDKIFPILYMVSESSAFVRGTGFIINYDGINYLLTARHVLEEENSLEYNKIAFPIFGQKKETWSLPYAPYMSKKNSGADIAVVPLLYEHDILEKMFWKPFGIDSFYSSNMLHDNQAIFVNGFPRELQNDLNGDPDISIGSLGFLTKLYTGNFNEIDNYNEKIDIIFDYKEEMLVDGDKTKIPALEGISGSPMFCIDHSIKGVWYPEKNMKIIGLEKAVKRNKYIKATKSSCLKKSLLDLLESIKS